MKQPPKTPPSLPPTETTTFAIFDIGSNAVRVDVYHVYEDRKVERLKNNAEYCELGKQDKPGYLSPDGLIKTRTVLKRYHDDLQRDWPNSTIIAVATEAIRSATDGPDFINELKRLYNLDVKILTTDEEGRLGARGVLASIPEADGIVADMGGGSVQLTRVSNGTTHETYSMPLGTLRLPEGTVDIDVLLDSHFKNLPPALRNAQNLYVIGGTWRTFGKFYKARAGQDSTVIDQTYMAPDKVREITKNITDKSRKEIETDLTSIYHIKPERAKTLPQAAYVLVRLIDYLNIEEIIVSSSGIRDGLLHEALAKLVMSSPRPTLPQHHSPS